MPSKSKTRDHARRQGTTMTASNNEVRSKLYRRLEATLLQFMREHPEDTVAPVLLERFKASPTRLPRIAGITKDAKESTTQKRALRVSEFCETYGVSKASTYNLIRAGRLHTVLVGGIRLIPVDAAERLLQSA